MEWGKVQQCIWMLDLAGPGMQAVDHNRCRADKGGKGRENPIHERKLEAARGVKRASSAR